MGYVEIPKIDVTEPIYHYSHEISLGKGICHIHGRSLSVGGKSTHSVLTGYRGLPNQKFFSDLDKVSVEDKFYIHVLGTVLAYRIYDIQEIEPTDVSVLFIEDDRDLVTLVTYTPYGVNTERLLVMGERIPVEELELDGDETIVIEEHGVVIGFMIFIFILFSLHLLEILSMTERKRKVVRDEENTCSYVYITNLYIYDTRTF